MFNALSKRLSGILDNLKNRGTINETDIQRTMRDIRIALLEADVALTVVKDFVHHISQKALGQDVLKSLQPGQMIVSIVHQELCRLLDHPRTEFRVPHKPLVIMMVGLQGSGKTTMTAKIAHWLYLKKKKNIRLASLDVYRPGAQEQLAVLAKGLRVPITCPVVTPSSGPSPSPLAIAQQALEEFSAHQEDVLLLDTAGRLSIDGTLMQELKDLKALANPQEILFVADAMMGQESAHTAQTFHEAVGLTGLCLSRVDGDARGGCALSIRFITNQPLNFLGTGEHPHQLEFPNPSHIAKRILGMDDVLSFVEQAVSQLPDNHQELSQKIQEGNFTLDDMAKNLSRMMGSGGMEGLLKFLPRSLSSAMTKGGAPNTPPQKTLRRYIAIISSMTPKERAHPRILNAARKKRIAKGSGCQVVEINRLLKQFQQASLLMKHFSPKISSPPKLLKGLLSRKK